jgi:hypothetical protein
MSLNELVWGVVGLLLTVMVLSYLIADNVFFRFAAHLFVGLTAGYLAVIIIQKILWPYLLSPLVAGPWTARLWLLVPLVLVALLLLSQIPRFSGVGSLPLAYLAGLAAAITIGGAVFGTLIPQTRAVVDAFDTARWYAVLGATWLRILEAGVMLLGTVSTLSYFHFGRKRNTPGQGDLSERPRLFSVLSKVGQVFIGITLGAVFAGVFSSALVALIDRINFIGQFLIRLLGGG